MTHTQNRPDPQEQIRKLIAAVILPVLLDRDAITLQGHSDQIAARVLDALTSSGYVIERSQ